MDKGKPDAGKANQFCQWLKKGYNSMKEWVEKYKKLAGFMLIVTLGVPPLLAYFIFECNFFACIPGKPDIWLGFWASYSGALATIVVAFLSFEGNKKLEEVEKAFRKKEKEYISTLIGINIRLSKVYIIPQKAEKRDDGSIFSRYRMGFVFKNVSYAMVQSIIIREVTIEGKIYPVNGEGKFFLEGDCPALEIEIFIPRGSEEEKRFSQFYFYYSQFGINRNELAVKVEVSIRMKKENQDSKVDDSKVEIKMKLEMKPEKDENFISNKVKIVSYTINVTGSGEGNNN